MKKQVFLERKRNQVCNVISNNSHDRGRKSWYQQHQSSQLEYPCQGRSQNLNQVPQNFMKALNLDDVTLTSQIMTSYRKIKITSEKIVNYRVTSPSNHCCQISFIVRERPGISAMMHFFLFLRCHSKIFKLLKPVYS